MTTEERLEKVEGQLARVRRSNRCLIGCIVLSLGVWFIVKTLAPETAWAQAAVKEIRANKFVLEDNKGKTRALLETLDDGTRLLLYDENGKSGVLLQAAKDLLMLMFYNEGGKPRAMLGTEEDGPGLVLNDENGQPCAVMAVDKNEPLLRVYDENGKPIWSAP